MNFRLQLFKKTFKKSRLLTIKDTHLCGE